MISQTALNVVAAGSNNNNGNAIKLANSSSKQKRDSRYIAVYTLRQERAELRRQSDIPFEVYSKNISMTDNGDKVSTVSK